MSLLIDGSVTNNQRLGDMIDDGLLEHTRLIGISSIVGIRNANVEDLFTPEDYLSLYNEAFGASITQEDLQGTDSIVSQLERHIGRKFDHLRPASALLRNRDRVSALSEDTLQQFTDLLVALNATFDEE